MRLVLDTNVLIAAFISHGVCHELLEHCVLNHDVVLSEFILKELQGKLTEKFAFTAREARAAAKLMASRVEITPITPLAKSVCRDPDDDAIIATALDGRCACIVTGDKDLLDLKSVQGIHVVSPGSFWEYEAKQAEDG